MLVRSGALLIALFAPLAYGILARAGGPQEGPREPPTGWNGESLPEGMQRAEQPLVYVWDTGKGLRVEMVYVPPGDFVMGSDDGDPDEAPRHTRRVPRGYYVGRFETTWREYAAYCASTGRAPPGWNQRGLCSDDDEPATGISRQEAAAYCTWAGLELPTEAQWEKAARGTDGRVYPWGDLAPSPRFGRWAPPDRRVGSDPRDVSPFGAFDMSGSVWEWCLDSYDDGAYRRHVDGGEQLPDRGLAVARGGVVTRGYRHEESRCADRVPLSPRWRHTSLGLRTARWGAMPASAPSGPY